MSVDEQELATRYVGARLARREDARLLTGRGTFVDDIWLPDLRHAAFVRSSVAFGRIVAVNTESARRLPGVHAVLTIDDLDRVRVAGPKFDPSMGTTAEDLAPLADGWVRFVGDPVAIVVADDRATAEDACELVTVDVEPLSPVLDIARVADDPASFAGPDGASPVLPPLTVPDPELATVIDSAPTVVFERIKQHRYLPAPMEPRGILAAWDAVAGELTVWSSTQGPHRVRDHMAAALGIAPNRVRVHVKDVGGGFGLKLAVSREDVATVLASRVIGAPVKWIEDRWENLVAATHARAEHADVTMAFDGSARIIAIDVDHVADVGAYGPPNLGIARIVAGPYRVPHVGGSSRSVRTNTSSRGAYRGPWMFETIARETMIDIAARRLGIDPLDLRRLNVIQQGDLPYRTVWSTYENVTPAETLEQAATMIGYEAFRAEQAAARHDGRYLGLGIALFMEHTAQGFGFGVTDAVTLRLDPSGSVQLITGLNSQGNSIETTMAQVVADHLGIEVADITFLNGDTAAVPVGASTGGSRNAVFGGGAARQAAIEMRERILGIAAHLLEAAPDDLDMRRGEVAVRGTPARSIAIGDVARIAYLEPARLPDGTPPGLEVVSRFKPGAGHTWSNAAHICTCEVDVETGVVTLLRYVVSEDCGTMINPNVVEGQIAGGVAQGIGGALFEEFVYDEHGTPLTTTLMDYLIPTAADVPLIEYGHIETPSARPGGFKGMGEGGAIGAPAAVFNAVADALAPLGVVLTAQPLSPAALIRAIETVSAP